MKTPDWDFWLRMPEVERDEACALALNIDPYSLRRPDSFPYRRSGFVPDSFPNYEYAGRFSKLLRLLEANLNNKYFTPTDGRNAVQLPEFAAWCASIDWEITPKLAALAKQAVLVVTKIEPAPDTTPAADVESNPGEIPAALFDPVPVEALEKMFPAAGKWKGWAGKAKANGLIVARDGRAKFNPYKAAVWFVYRGLQGWDLDRCLRVLTNNLPARSKDDKHLLTGELD